MTDGNKNTKILVLVGSLRKDSVNRALARVAADNAPIGVAVERYTGLELLPFYNEDIDGDTAGVDAARLRDAVADADAVLIATPEYNGTVPAVLKNAGGKVVGEVDLHLPIGRLEGENIAEVSDVVDELRAAVAVLAEAVDTVAA